MERQLAGDVPLHPAATVMLLRDGETGVEVFMVQRTHSAAFARSQYVFPGGRVDLGDEGLEAICDGVDDASASARLGLGRGGLAWLVAAIRECFEEAGVLLARRRDADEIVRFDERDLSERIVAARRAVHDGDRTFADVCAAEDLVLLADRLRFVAHWVTPLGERRRFDTRFFVAEAPASQEPLHDDAETIASLWVAPSTALDMHAGRQIQMFPPTVACLRELTRYATVGEALGGWSANGLPPRIEPRLVVDTDGRMVGIRVPGDSDYESTPLQHYVLGAPR